MVNPMIAMRIAYMVSGGAMPAVLAKQEMDVDETVLEARPKKRAADDIAGGEEESPNEVMN